MMIRVKQLRRSFWTEMQGLDLDLRGCEGDEIQRVFLRFHVSHQIKVPKQTRSSRVKLLLSLLLISQDTVFLMSHLPSLPEHRFQPASTNKALIYPRSPFYFLFKAWTLMAANSGNRCSVCSWSRWTNVTWIVFKTPHWLRSRPYHWKWSYHTVFSRILEHILTTSCFKMCCRSFIVDSGVLTQLHLITKCKIVWKREISLKESKVSYICSIYRTFLGWHRSISVCCLHQGHHTTRKSIL